ncbi:aquaporin [Microcella daejeonensis]|uniref:Aquaporin n=1 Tax=Microcella daejeonensis TaxID=2994971 RepID=A0A9E8SBW3_9MICO|nr:aquaporin [Microcella daejeonensis]WAB81967.1 aquaporin [Microcella daejeonensis]
MLEKTPAAVTAPGSAAPAPPALRRRLLAELLGSAGLAMAVIGSGIMATRLTDEPGLQLLINALVTAMALPVLIACLAPIGGAHLNPAVSLVMALRRELPPREALAYAGAQVLGCLSGAVVAHLQFGLPAGQVATTARLSGPTLLAEVIATAGLVAVILLLIAARRPLVIAPAVGAYIGAAYFVTSSTSFANPAITIGRMASDTYAGIAPLDGLGFIGAQLVGALLGMLVVRLLVGRPAARSADSQP